MTTAQKSVETSAHFSCCLSPAKCREAAVLQGGNDLAPIRAPGFKGTNQLSAEDLRSCCHKSDGTIIGSMPALPQNSQAPDFRLQDAEGAEFHLYSALESGRVLLTFYKADCPTCQYALPYLDRFKSLLDGAAAVTVSQDTPVDAERFSAEFAYSTKQVFDTEEAGFEVSEAYGLTNVPTVFLVGTNGRIEHTIVNWWKADVEELAGKLGVDSPFQPGEDVFVHIPGCGSRN